MKKFSLVAVSIVMAFALAFSLAGCGNADEKVIRDSLTKEFNQFKDPKSKMWKVDMKDNLKELSDLGVNTDDLIAAWVKDFSFKVGTIKIEGNKATAEVSITCKQLFPAIEKATEKLSNDPNLSNMSEKQAMKKWGEQVIAELNSAKAVTTVISIPWTKTGNTWEEDAAAEAQYSKALMGPEPKY